MLQKISGFLQAEFTIFCPVPGLQFTAVVDKIIDTEILCVYNNFKVRAENRKKSNMFCSPEPEIPTISKFTRNYDIVQIIPYCALKIHALFYVCLSFYSSCPL